MEYENCFKYMFNSIPDYEKIVLLIFLIRKDKKLLKEVGFSKTDINLLNLEFKNVLIEEHENYFDYGKDQEESVLEKFLKKVNGTILQYYFYTSILFLKILDMEELLFYH